MVHFGRTEVEHIPEEIIYHEVYVEKLICKNCKEEDDLFITKCATAPQALIPHSFATPSLIAFVGYQKYQMGVPNYRLEKHFERKGILISRSSMILPEEPDPLLSSSLLLIQQLQITLILNFT